MGVRRFIVLVLVALFAPAIALGQTVPNPVQLQYGFRGPAKSYDVGCFGAPGIRGTWVPVTGSTFTTQEALIYRRSPKMPMGATGPSILYCFGTDGKSGSISGAPLGLVLPTGSRVEVHPLIQLIMTYVADGETHSNALGIPLSETTQIDARPARVVVKQSDTELAVYPGGTRITVGFGESTAFFRPGTSVEPIVQSNAGCTVSYFNTRAEVMRTMHDVRNCSDVEYGLLL